MSACVLLNLSNSSQKRDNILGKPHILSLFSTRLINSITQGILYMTLNLLKKAFFLEKVKDCHLLLSVKMDVIICEPQVVNQFYCMALYHSQTRHDMIKSIFPCARPAASWHIIMFWCCLKIK